MNIWESIKKEALADQKNFSSHQKKIFDEDLMKSAEDYGSGLSDLEKVEDIGANSEAGNVSNPFELDLGEVADVEVPSAVAEVSIPNIKQDTERIDPYDEGVYA